MVDLYGWACIRVDTYDDELDELEKVKSDIRRRQEQCPPLGYGVHFGQDFVVMHHFLNHSHQAEPYFEFFHYIAQVAPGSYGLLYFGDDEGLYGKDPNKFYVLRMARGKVEKLEDTLLSPRIPVIEDPDPPSSGATWKLGDNFRIIVRH